MASYHNSLKLALLLSCSLIVLNLFCIPVHALNISLLVAGSAVSVSKECSRKGESHFCKVPPFLRYGKYCGLLYSGCPGEKPCDGLDACCMMHYHCVVAKTVVSVIQVFVMSKIRLQCRCYSASLTTFDHQAL